jgi:hypothetical protein
VPFILFSLPIAKVELHILHPYSYEPYQHNMCSYDKFETNNSGDPDGGSTVPVCAPVDASRTSPSANTLEALYEPLLAAIDASDNDLQRHLEKEACDSPFVHTAADCDERLRDTTTSESATARVDTRRTPRPIVVYDAEVPACSRQRDRLALPTRAPLQRRNPPSVYTRRPCARPAPLTVIDRANILQAALQGMKKRRTVVL